MVELNSAIEQRDFSDRSQITSLGVRSNVLKQRSESFPLPINNLANGIVAFMSPNRTPSINDFALIRTIALVRFHIKALGS